MFGLIVLGFEDSEEDIFSFNQSNNPSTTACNQSTASIFSAGFFLAAAIGILAAPVVRGLSGVGEQTGGVSLRSSSISASISGVHGLYRAALSL